VASLLGKTRPALKPDPSEVAWAARRLKISQQAAVLRLEQLGIFQAGTYQSWLATFSDSENPDFSDKGGGSGGPPPQEKVKLARYGALDLLMPSLSHLSKV
jgi:Zn-dependent peptidase ImmA (M78 family)